MVRHSALSGSDLHPPMGLSPTPLVLPNSTTDAYRINNNAGNVAFRLDTSNSGTGLYVCNIGSAGVPTIPVFVIPASFSSAFLIEDSAGNDYLEIDSASSPEEMTFGNSTTDPLFIFTGQGAIRVTQVTTTERDAITAQNGMVVYNTTTGELQARIGGSWVALGTSGGTFSEDGTTATLWYVNEDASPTNETCEVRLGGGDGTDEFRVRMLLTPASNRFDIWMEDDNAGGGTFAMSSNCVLGLNYNGGSTANRGTTIWIGTGNGSASTAWQIAASAAGSLTVSSNLGTNKQISFTGNNSFSIALSDDQVDVFEVAQSTNRAFYYSSTNSSERIEVGNTLCGQMINENVATGENETRFRSGGDADEFWRQKTAYQATASGGGPTNALTVAIPSGYSGLICAHVSAREQSAGGLHRSWIIEIGFENNGGTVTMDGTPHRDSEQGEAIPGADVALIASSGNVVVQLTHGSSDALHWIIHVDYHYVRGT